MANNIIEVNQKTCTRCGTCAAICPLGLIEFNDGNFPSPTASIETSCIRCGQCVAVCPTGSLIHRVVPLEKCIPINEGLRISAEQCEQLLKSRRSVRVFTDKPVPRDIIAKLIDTARFAPTGHNSQCVEWLVIDDRKEHEKIKQAVTEWVRWFIEKKPELAGPMEMSRLLARQESGKDELMHDAPVLVVAHASASDITGQEACTIALTYFQLAAMSTGLGTCWAGFVEASSGFPAVKEVLALPKDHRNYGSMLLGYPRYVYQRIPTRKPPRITWR